MGVTQSCCRPTDLNTGESQPQFVYKKQVSEQEIDYRQYQKPDQQIAIRLETLKESIRDEKQQNKLNQFIFKFAQMQKKIQKPLTLKKPKISRNQIKELYFIESLQAIYIGEWVYNKKERKDVPGGIGRLFSKDTIYEGVFKTFFLRDDEVWYNKRIQQSYKKRQKLQNLVSQIQDPINLHLNKKKNEENSESYPAIHQTNSIMAGQNTPENKQFNQKPRASSTEDFLGSLQKNTNKSFDTNLLFTKLNTKFLHEQFQDGERAKNDNYTRTATFFKEFNVKLHGYGRIITHDIEMQGQFDQGVLHGKGIFKKHDINYLYDGSWQYGNKQGKGKQSTKKFIYQGDFVNNMRTGKGKLRIIFAARQEHAAELQQAKYHQKYSQEIEELVRDAKSLITIRKNRDRIIEQETSEFPGSNIKFSENHMVYQVNFVIQHKNKNAFFQSYMGTFENNEKHGKGTYVWMNGKTYNGQWKHDKMDGFGQFYWPNGAAYEGTYKDDQRHGKGMMIWSSFKRYRGNWAFGFRHGYGQSIQIDETGDSMIIRGDIWNRDEIEKQLFQHKINDIRDFHLDEDDIKKQYEQQLKKEEQNEENKFLFFKF